MNRKLAMSVPISSAYPFDPEIKLLRSIGLARSLVLDIGANTGAFAEFVEDLVGCSNLVLFEPLPQLHPFLSQRFGDARIFSIALSNKAGDAMMHVPAIDGEVLLSRATLNDHTEPDQSNADEIEVPTFPLDAIAEAFEGQAIGLVKIDVEGHELGVLDGAENTIVRFKPLILIEIEARHHEFPIDTVFSRIQGWGYKGFYLDPVACELRDTAQFDATRDQNLEYLRLRQFNRYLNNFFFVHESTYPNFASEATSFLSFEKRSAETWPKTLPERIASHWLRFREQKRRHRRTASG